MAGIAERPEESLYNKVYKRMLDIDPNNRPGIYEILRYNFNNSMVYDDIKDKAEHLNSKFKGI